MAVGKLLQGSVEISVYLVDVSVSRGRPDTVKITFTGGKTAHHIADFEVCRFLISRVKWGGDKFVGKIDGRKIKRGKNFRFGHRHRIEGSDLIVWLKTESKKPIKISLTPINN